MPHQLEDVDFAQDPFCIGSVGDLALLEDLDGGVLASDLVAAEDDLAKSALSQGLAWIRRGVPNTKSPNYLLGGQGSRFI